MSHRFLLITFITIIIILMQWCINKNPQMINRAILVSMVRIFIIKRSLRRQNHLKDNLLNLRTLTHKVLLCRWILMIQPPALVVNMMFSLNRLIICLLFVDQFKTGIKREYINLDDHEDLPYGESFSTRDDHYTSTGQCLIDVSPPTLQYIPIYCDGYMMYQVLQFDSSQFVLSPCDNNSPLTFDPIGINEPVKRFRPNPGFNKQEEFKQSNSLPSTIYVSKKCSPPHNQNFPEFDLKLYHCDLSEICSFASTQLDHVVDHMRQEHPKYMEGYETVYV